MKTKKRSSRPSRLFASSSRKRKISAHSQTGFSSVMNSFGAPGQRPIESMPASMEFLPKITRVFLPRALVKKYFPE
jgi:hypothetical protein